MTTTVHVGPDHVGAPGYCRARLTLTLGGHGLAVGVCELPIGHDDEHRLTVAWDVPHGDHRPDRPWCATCGRLPGVVRVDTDGTAICGPCANHGGRR